MRFTLSYHTKCSGKKDHYDLFLEDKDSLVTFSLDKPLSIAKNCTKINDHRKVYLDFEGKISDEKGSVRIVEKGKLEYIEKLTDKISFTILDEKRSVIVIQRQKGDIWLIEKT